MNLLIFILKQEVLQHLEKKAWPTEGVTDALSDMKYGRGKCPSVFKQPWPTERVQPLKVKHLGSLSQKAQRLKPYTPPTVIITATLWSAPNADYPRPALTKHAGRDKSRPSADWFHLINSL